MDQEETVVGAINALVDAALESAEAALLNLDTDANAVECGGRFVPRPQHRQLVLERTLHDPNRVVTFTDDSNSGSSNTSIAAPSIPTVVPSPTPADRRRRHRSPARGPVDVFRFPVHGEDARLSARDGVYTSMDNKSLLIVRDLQDGTCVNNDEVQRLQHYYDRLKTTKQCQKCNKTLYKPPPSPNPSRASSATSTTTSVQSPVDSFTANTEPPPVSSSLSSVTGSTFSATPTITPASVPTEYTTSRLTSSVVTKPSTTAPSCRSSGTMSASTSGLSVDFTTVVKDPKSGQNHPLHFVAKCPQGQPARIYINGKAFGPCSD